MVYHQMQNYLQMTFICRLFYFSNSASAKELNNDLVKINRWAYQWKMSFNPDPRKQAQKVIFSRKTKKNTILLSLLTTIMYRKLIHKSI